MDKFEKGDVLELATASVMVVLGIAFALFFMALMDTDKQNSTRGQKEETL